MAAESVLIVGVGQGVTLGGEPFQHRVFTYAHRQQIVVKARR